MGRLVIMVISTSVLLTKIIFDYYFALQFDAFSRYRMLHIVEGLSALDLFVSFPEGERKLRGMPVMAGVAHRVITNGHQTRNCRSSLRLFQWERWCINLFKR